MHHVHLFFDWPPYILTVKFGSKRFMVFPPCTTVLVYLTHSMVQVHSQPLCVCVCGLCVYVYARTDMPTHTYMNRDKWALPHTWARTHNHTSGYTHAPAPPPPTHTHTIEHTSWHTHANKHWSMCPHKWEHLVMHTHRHAHTHKQGYACMHIWRYGHGHECGYLRTHKYKQ
jgi:hypothetical protein